jgi:endonuclease YncB( thermonuclease family)
MIVWLALAAPAHTDIVGVASVVDADTIEIDGQRIWLHGIDAPESSQTLPERDRPEMAVRAGGSPGTTGPNWRAHRHLDERDVDRYGRIIGRSLVGGLDINEWRWLRAWLKRAGNTPVTKWPQRTRRGEAGERCGRARSSRLGSGGTGAERQRRAALCRSNCPELS